MNIDDPESDNWAIPIAKEKFYDGAVIHPYISLTTTKVPDLLSLRQLCESYMEIKKAMANYKKIFQDRPLYFTEWGVNNETAMQNTMAALFANADCFFAIIEGCESGLIKMACKHNLMGQTGLYMPPDENGKIKISIHQIFYRMLIDTFSGAELFSAMSSSAEIAPGVPAVIARAACAENGAVHVFACNKTRVPFELVLNINGKSYTGSHSMKYLADDDIGSIKNFYEGDEIVIVKKENGKIMLPAYSICTLTVEK